MSAPRQAEREARRLFPRLASGAWLVPDRSAWPASSGTFLLVSASQAIRAAPLHVPAALVDYWQGQDWLEGASGAANGALVLSQAGHAWLRRQGAGADPYRAQHQLRRMAARTDAAGGGLLQVNDAESPLGWLRNRKDASGRPLIGAAQYEAGERLRADFWRAGMSPRITSNPGAPPPGRRMRRGAADGPAGLTEAALAARQRVEKALDEVGPELSGILLDVCCFSQGLESAERTHGWPQRSGKIILQLALTRLARHYGLLPPALSWNRRGGIRSWGASGYRPTINRWK